MDKMLISIDQWLNTGPRGLIVMVLLGVSLWFVYRWNLAIRTLKNLNSKDK